MTNEEKEIIYKIRKGEIDVNNQQLFLSILIKGLIWNLNQNIKIRDIPVPHFIINTGDDIMYLEVKGQDHSIEPLEVSNENFVYNSIPRCLVTPEGISIPTDDLSSPYSNGMFQYESEDNIYSYTAEFRRLPMEISVSLKYYFDSYTDSLEGIQRILTHCAFVNIFDIQYLGQTIRSSYQISDQYEAQYQVEFDGLSQDNKSRIVEMDITIDTNMPIIQPRTAILGDMFIKEAVHTLDIPNERTQIRQFACSTCNNFERTNEKGSYLCPTYLLYKKFKIREMPLQRQANWKQENPEKVDFIMHKPDIPDVEDIELDTASDNDINNLFENGCPEYDPGD